MPKNLTTLDEALSHTKRNPIRLADCLLTQLSLHVKSSSMEMEILVHAAMYCYMQRLNDLKDYPPIEAWINKHSMFFFFISGRNLKRWWWFRKLGKEKKCITPLSNVKNASKTQDTNMSTNH